MALLYNSAQDSLQAQDVPIPPIVHLTDPHASRLVSLASTLENSFYNHIYDHQLRPVDDSVDLPTLHRTSRDAA